MQVDAVREGAQQAPSDTQLTFEAFGLSPELVRAVGEAGFSEPTPIQTQAIPHILRGRDVLGRAQTGTGKTAAYVLPIIDILSETRARARMPRALILAPTRELAAQIAEHFANLGRYRQLSLALLIGGVSPEDQERRLDRGVDVVIATPGRLLDHFERGKVILYGLKALVIDEADRMLDMGFIPDVERIIRLLPPLRQTLMFSATMPAEIRRLADSFMLNPKEVSVSPPASPAEAVDHAAATVGPQAKREALRRLIAAEGIEQALIFCNRKKDVTLLRDWLAGHGFSEVATLHGDMSQPDRTATLEAFREGLVKLLIASDVAGRGLDIVDLPFVINFDVPANPEDYIHRIGRTGRAGKRGKAFTLATPRDEAYLAAIERLIGCPIRRVEIAGVDSFAPSSAPDKKRRRRRGKDAAKERTAERGARQEDQKRASTQAGKGARGGRKRRDGEKETEVGWGDHVPAFLLKPTQRN